MYLTQGRESRWSASPAVPPIQRSLVRNDGAFLYLKFNRYSHCKLGVLDNLFL